MNLYQRLQSGRDLETTLPIPHFYLRSHDLVVVNWDAVDLVNMTKVEGMITLRDIDAAAREAG